MFQLTAVFNRTNLNDVLQELSERQIPGVTVTDVQGKGGLSLNDKSGEIELDDNVMMTIILADESQKEAAKEIVRSNTRDLAKNSGKMWVTAVLEVERIRTGETDEAALRLVKQSEHVVHDDFFTHQDTPSS